MADIDKVKRNIQRMIDQGAPETDIDAYVSSEGVSLDQLQGKSAKPSFTQQALEAAQALTPMGIGKELYGAIRDPQKAMQTADDSVRLLANGGTLGFLDKALGKDERAKTNDARQRQGVRGMATEVVGSMVPMTAAAKMGLTAANIPGAVGKYAGPTLEGMGWGGATAYGNDQPAAQGMLIGGAGGLAAQVAGGVINKGYSAFSPAPKQMSAEELKAAGTAAFQKADDAGAVYSPEAIARLRDTVKNDYAEFGFHPTNQPGAGVAYDELARLAEGGNVNTKGLQSARRIASGGYNPTNPSNNSLIGKTTGRIDEFMANAGPGDVIAGDSQAASAAMKEGNDYWSRLKKLEKVQELLGRAELNAGSSGSGGNVGNATRQQLKRILTDKKMMRGFTKDELDLTRKAVLGTKTQNALRAIGAMSPAGNGLGKMIWGAGMGGAAASGVGVLPLAGAAALAGATSGAKYLAPKLGERTVSQLERVIAGGGSKSALEGAKMSPAAQKQIRDFLRALVLGGTTAAVTQGN
jgi:hypothetical protein